MSSYKSITSVSEARYTVKMSRFLAFALPVTSENEAKALIKKYQNEYHDARHVCWAYMLGADRTRWQVNDNGEPSGTAGKPILGQINSFGLTDICVIVVRYFGGIKLGTPGLIAAYREAARMALDEANISEMHEMSVVRLEFPYPLLNDVMYVVKMMQPEIVERQFDNDCMLAVRLKKEEEERFMGLLPDGVKRL